MGWGNGIISNSEEGEWDYIQHCRGETQQNDEGSYRVAKIFMNYSPDKGLISGVYKDLKILPPSPKTFK